MEESKSIFASKTFWGAIVAVIAGVAALFKIDLGDQEALATVIASLVGAIIAIYGRIKAVKKIG
jgi:LytS/YehU family sensor histidine kinase